MARTRVQLNHPGMAALLRSSGVAGEMHRRAESALGAAQAAAPVASGAYRASLHVEDVTTDRAVSRVVADVPYALVLEARLRVLGRSIDAAGG